MTQYLIVPGLGSSGPEHWQTYFEQQLPNCARIEQREWETPNCIDWISSIQKAMMIHKPHNIVLIGNSPPRLHSYCTLGYNL